jgi:hypothetical protein
VTVLPIQKIVLVASMFEKVIYQYDPLSNQASVWSEVLPGYIDNLSYDPDTNSVWAALFQPQLDPLLRFSYRFIPSVRFLFNFLPAPNQSFGGVVQISADSIHPRKEGVAELFLNDQNGSVISSITDVQRVGNQLLFGSFNNFIGRYNL